MKTLLPSLCLAMAMAAPPTWAQLTSTTTLLPLPKQYVEQGGTKFQQPSGATLSVFGLTQLPALDLWLAEHGLSAHYKDSAAGVQVVFQKVGTIPGAHRIELKGYGNEAYTLNITDRQITVQYVDTIGAIRAVQTLAQMAQAAGKSGLALPQARVVDWPAFNVRGYMHDVGRSFLSVEELKRQIDLFARFKVNTFHWHFTENQAWRLEIKALPQLTQASNMTRFAGKYYTQDQVREVINYATARGVYIIPEIDMPGHSEAFVRAMGHDMQTDAGVDKLKTILTEVCALFPEAPYIHIGADEKDITYQKNGRNFVQIMIDHVKAQGQRAMIWNPIHSVSIATSGAEMTQMWSSAGKAIAGLPNVDCRYNYTNHFDVFADLVGIYKSNIYYQSQGTTEAAGAITAPWNDRFTATEDDIVRQNNHYAVTIATAERAWKGGGKQYIEVGGTTLPNIGEEYEEFADFERRFLHHKLTTLAAAKHQIPYVKQSHVRWHITEGFPNEGDTARVFPPEQAAQQEAPLPTTYTYQGKTYKATVGTGAGIYLRHTWGNSTMPTFYGTKTNPAFNQTAYAWTYVYSPQAQTVGAHIEFQNYGRSERDLAPEAGRWDRKGSKIWVNGTEIKAPAWKNAGVNISWGRVADYEKPLQDENFTAREPISIQLKAGWNKIFIKLPFIDLSKKGVRLNKWMFTCALIDLATGEAVSNVHYSPTQSANPAHETLTYAVAEAEKALAMGFKDEVGFYPTALTAPLRAELQKAQTLMGNATATLEQAQAQISALTQATAALRATLSTASIVQPTTSTQSQPQWYSLSTPNRGNRYATSRGVGKDVQGQTTPTNSSAWLFATRPDGSYNLINADGSYLSPNSANDTALRTSAEAPTTGWSVKPSAAQGLVIITSNEVQINQTNKTGLPLYNWGNGSNTTDGGCQIAVRPFVGNVTGLSSLSATSSATSTYDLAGRPVQEKASGLLIRNGEKVLQ